MLTIPLSITSSTWILREADCRPQGSSTQEAGQTQWWSRSMWVLKGSPTIQEQAVWWLSCLSLKDTQWSLGFWSLKKDTEFMPFSSGFLCLLFWWLSLWKWESFYAVDIFSFWEWHSRWGWNSTEADISAWGVVCTGQRRAITDHLWLASKGRKPGCFHA